MKVLVLLSLQITATWPPEEVAITAVARVPLGSPPVGWYRPQKACGASVCACGVPTAAGADAGATRLLGSVPTHRRTAERNPSHCGDRHLLRRPGSGDLQREQHQHLHDCLLYTS